MPAKKKTSANNSILNKLLTFLANILTKAFMFVITLIVFGFIFITFLSIITGGNFEDLDGNVAIIKIDGPIVAQDVELLFTDVSSSDSIGNFIRRAAEDDDIKAIVFEINSPGGSAVASDEIASEIKKVNKTTVAWVREIGTSGAYWIASSTDHIVANRMSITGSIGVIASYLEFSGFLEEHNVSYERLVSGKFKDLGSPFKDLTDAERRLFEDSLDDIHDAFVDEVAVNRNLTKRNVQKIATGQFFLGSKAKELGLVDELGSRDELIKYVEEQIGEEADFVRYRKQKGFLSALSQSFNEKSFFIGKGLGNAFFTEAEKPTSISIIT
jgi:protease-4